MVPRRTSMSVVVTLKPVTGTGGVSSAEVKVRDESFWGFTKERAAVIWGIIATTLIWVIQSTARYVHLNWSARRMATQSVVRILRAAESDLENDAIRPESIEWPTSEGDSPYSLAFASRRLTRARSRCGDIILQARVGVLDRPSAISNLRDLRLDLDERASGILHILWRFRLQDR